MEPPREKVAFTRVDGAGVVLIVQGQGRSFPLWELAGELFAGTDFAGFLQLFRDGFTSDRKVRWEHFINSPHIRCNSLGRIILNA